MARLHSAKLVLKGDDQLETEWVGYNQGKAADTKRFFLTRKK